MGGDGDGLWSKNKTSGGSLTYQSNWLITHELELPLSDQQHVRDMVQCIPSLHPGISKKSSLTEYSEEAIKRTVWERRRDEDQLLKTPFVDFRSKKKVLYRLSI